ncbi:putative virion core protein [Candidatus Moduliflexus flocculans]|uniref:Putative virion core protein n=1 Tax=Candidatus Moduliflexus flocculans TaxID=1499966 RepID=A0A0S6W0T5_9BACT|nr:putative virion core protein [Candidatus Moduliflexus flocculans]
MSLWDKIAGQLIDIIEWLDSTQDTIVFRFERQGNEIKNGAKLIVRESQVALFVNEGQIADIFDVPSTYTLETKNLPILGTLKGWKYGFNSPFKAEVYFVNTRRFMNLKWGLKNPLMLRDAEFGVVRVRAFGTYGIRVSDPSTLLRQLVGMNPDFSTEDISEQIRNMIVSRFSEILAEMKIPVLDVAANYSELGDLICQKMRLEMVDFGIELINLMVENVSLPPEVEAAMDKRASMGVIGNLSAYTQFQAAEAMEAAAKNPGGDASAGIGMGMGFAMANQMSRAMNQPNQPQQAGAPTPPPLPQAVAFHVALDGQSAGPFDLNVLKTHIQSGKLTRDTLVWKDGMASWTPAGQVAELAGLFGSTPPPLPPR